MKAVRQRLFSLVTKNFPNRVKSLSLNEETVLMEGGLELDSFALLQFMMLLESEFSINFEEPDFTMEHFHSLGTLSELLERRTAI